MITVVANNYPGTAESLRTAWGFAAVIEAPGGAVLFDSGSEGGSLMHNMRALGIGAESIRHLVLSHDHWDHTGGMSEFLAASPGDCAVYAPRVFSEATKGIVSSAGRRLVETEGPVEVAGGIVTSRVLAGPMDEQALAVRSDRGLVVLTGCAHPGVAEMARAAGDAAGGEIDLILGGFHLMNEGEGAIRAASEELRALGVGRVGPTHCTGDLAREFFAAEWGDSLVDADLGARIEIGRHG